MSDAIREQKRQARLRQINLGISKCIWRYANWGRSPCDHSSLDGKRYPLNRGMKFKGSHIFPGEEDGCQCMSSPVIEGFIE